MNHPNNNKNVKDNKISNNLLKNEYIGFFLYLIIFLLSLSIYLLIKILF